MKLTKYAVGLALIATMGFASIAGAAANLTHLTVDGRTDTTVSEGDTVEARVTFDVTTSTDVESLSWELVGSGLPETCVNATNSIADGTFTRSFDLDTEGATEGSWDVTIRLFGDDGADASNLCENTDLVDSQTFSDRITVTDDNDDNQDDDDNNTGGNSVRAQMQAQIDQIKALLAQLIGGSTPGTQSPKCAALSTKTVGTVPHTYNDANTRLQGYLLSEGATIPALTAGASFGYYGPQTMAAVQWYKTVNSCN